MKRLSIALLAILSAPVGASAQKLPRDGAADDIVITARIVRRDGVNAASKSGLARSETPQAISIVDASLIDDLNVRTVSEALNYTSGVRSQAFGSDTRIDYYQIRGFAQSSFFKDGLVLYNSGPFLAWTTPAEGIERLEVVKGPSSALYGGGSAGGLVNIVSKRPLRLPSSRTEVGFDEYGSAYVSADLAGGVAKGLSARLVGLVRRGKTQVELARDDRTYAAGSLSWTLGKGTTMTLRASYTADRSNRPTGFLPYRGFVTPLPDGRRIPIDLFVSDPATDRYDRDQFEAGYAFEGRLSSSLRFMSNSRFGRISLVQAGLYGASDGSLVSAGGRWLLRRMASHQSAWLEGFTTDNHLEAGFRTGSLRHDVLGGMEYGFSDTASTISTGAAPSLDVFAPSYGVPLVLGVPATTRQKLDQFGLYVQDAMHLGGFVALLSTRHDWIGITSRGGSTGVTRGAEARQTYRVGVSRPTRIGLAPYVAFATSFSPVVGAEAATGRFFRPETGRSWEVGLKYEPEAIPMTASVSLFTIERNGVLVSNPVAGFPNNQSQLGAVRSRGGELELQAHPLPALNVVAAVSAFRIGNRSGPRDTIGRSPTATPEFTASAFVDYTIPVGHTLPGLGFGAGVRHVGRSFADAANLLIVPSATVFDAALHLDVARLRFAANVSNVLDRRYVGACASQSTCYAANLRRATFSIVHRLGANR